MSRPLMVDLFCGEGGAAAGYVRAGFRVWGVDRNPKLKARYLASGAERFICADAMTWKPEEEPAAEHASPPCEDHSATMQFGNIADHGTGHLLAATIAKMQARGGPWVVENVERAHMPGAIVLCGSEFGLGARDSRGTYRILRRHRKFLSNIFLWGAGGCYCAGRPVGGVFGHGEQGRNGGRGYGFDADAAREAMEMPWASRDGVTEAIPPAYAEWVGAQLLAHLQAKTV